MGAGPGDAELITFKGYKLICQADVILHDHLISSELLRLAKPTAEVQTSDQLGASQGVIGRLKPATMGAFKTSHFEERKVCHKYSPIPTMTGLEENHYGKSTQNGYGKRDIDIERAWQSLCCENLRLLRPKGLLRK